MKRFAVTMLLGAVIIGGFLYLGLADRNSLPVADNLAPAAETNNAYEPGPVVQQGPRTTETALCGAGSAAVVTKVVDGDTVVVAGGYQVRLLYIDADEFGTACFEPAKERLEELILNKTVALEKDTTDTDRYGRCLRTLFMGGENINARMAKDGMAVARFFLPDVKHRAEIQAAEKEAMAKGVGCKWQ